MPLWKLPYWPKSPVCSTRSGLETALFTSLVLRERADVADVECVCDDYSFVAAERERIMRLSREQAIREVLKGRKIENRIRAVESVADNDLLGLE